MIHVIATIEVQPGKRAEFLAEFAKVIPPTRAEAGCIEYGPTVDLATKFPAQPPLRENVVTILEKWRDLPALEQHMTSPHMIEYRSRVAALVQKVTLHVTEPVAESASASIPAPRPA